jgi:hypothetical protein
MRRGATEDENERLRSCKQKNVGKKIDRAGLKAPLHAGASGKTEGPGMVHLAMKNVPCGLYKLCAALVHQIVRKRRSPHTP